jgi:hypothetical protein
MTNIIVSGCPRSGTSMLMRILDNAGLPIATDKERRADKDNVHGYFEVDNIVNKLKEKPEFVFDYDGKVLKVIHYGLQYLPKGDYKLVYIERDLDEVMMSMEKMIGVEDPKREQTKRAFAAFNDKAKAMADERDDIDFLLVAHRDLVTDPAPVVDEIISFLDIDPARKDDMLSAIDPTQYRNRTD